MSWVAFCCTLVAGGISHFRLFNLSLSSLKILMLICRVSFICSQFLAGLQQCQKERQQSLGWSRKSLPGVFVPECDTEGEYKSTQCHEASEYCWCVDAQGNEIPRTRSRGRTVCRPSGNCPFISGNYIK